jgi:hypothetical protein
MRNLETEGEPIVLGIPQDDWKKDRQSQKKRQIWLFPPQPISPFGVGKEKKKNTRSEEDHGVLAEQAKTQSDPG